MKKILLALAVLGAFAGTASAVTVEVSTIYLRRRHEHRAQQLRRHCRQSLRRERRCPAGDASDHAAVDHLLRSASPRQRGSGRPVGQFQIEHRFNPDTGRQNQTPPWNGRSYRPATAPLLGSSSTWP